MMRKAKTISLSLTLILILSFLTVALAPPVVGQGNGTGAPGAQPQQGPSDPSNVKESVIVPNTPAYAAAANSPMFNANITTQVGLKKVSPDSALNSPVKAISPPDGSNRLFVADQTGKIWIMLPNGTWSSAPFLDITNKLVNLSTTTEDERGLLGLAFHPNFAQNGKFYVYYSANPDWKAPSMWNCTNHLAEFKVNSSNANLADVNSERTLLMINKPYQNHNGGDINFGPGGFLYLPTGDGGRADDTGIGHPAGGNGQDLWELLGKVLRLDVNQNANVNAKNTSEWQTGSMGYGIPSDNPFVNSHEGRPEIWAWGLRNPWRASFDMGGNNTYFVSNAGQKLWEGIDTINKGQNLGWNIMENGHPYNRSQMLDINATARRTTGFLGEPLTNPILSIPNFVPGDPVYVAIGGYVYRGANISALDGSYIFGLWGVNSTIKFAQQQSNGSWMYGNVSLNLASNGSSVSGLSGTYIQSFGQDSKGEMYVLTTNDLQPLSAHKTGAVWMLVPPGSNQTSNQSSGATPAPSASQPSQQNQSGASSSSSAVTIQNFAFSPIPLTVKSGTTVTWTNKDNADHTATTTSGPASFDSKNIAPGQTFSYTFSQAGTYDYICTIHPTMHGQVIVQ